MPESWPIRLKDVTLVCRLTAFRHLGIFPEQLPHWEWMLQGLGGMRVERPRVLNLFAYTGAATMLAARAGAEITHVDASKRAISWGKENQQASGLDQAPIRWLLDDARKFVQREVRRGKTYNVILVDPPKFGRGPNNEVWDLFEHLPQLMRDCAAILDKNEAQLILTAYAIRASALAIDQVARWPVHTTQIANSYHNQLEVPVLFYVLVLLVLHLRMSDIVHVVLAWAFVLSRFAHAYIHTTNNDVRIRGPVFGIGLLILLVMWIWFAIRFLAASAPL